LTATKLRRLLGEFVECGGDGLEVVSGSHNRDETYHMARMAETFGLWASAGSDFHGPERTWAQLGRLPRMPGNCRPVWEHPDWPERAVMPAEASA
ncbi:MAG TPA: phosphatase, partial [Gammaproteobacteria bacterium]|nr:phosphatase [Gammaproteobacteria bacterium]